MRKAVLLLLFTVLFAPLSASSQPVIVIDSVDRTLCGNLYPWGETIQYIAICNPDTTLERLDFAIRFSSPDGAAITMDPENALTFYNDFLTLFEPLPIGYSLQQDGDDWVLSVITGYLPDMGGGWEPSPDTIIFIGIGFANNFSYDLHICVDSTTSGMVTEWLAGPGPPPTFGGGVCYQVDRVMPNCTALLESGSDCYGTSGYCWPVTYTMEVTDDCFAPALVLGVIEGLGWVEYVPLMAGYGQAIYHYTPTAADYGTQFFVQVRLREDWCGDGSYLRGGNTVGFIVAVGTDDALVGDLDGSGVVDISDLQELIYIMFIEPQEPADPRVCDADCSGGVDITDVSFLVDNLFLTLAPLCDGC